MKNKIAKWYRYWLWSKARVTDAVKKGVITAADYEEITGEVYVDV